MIATPRVSVIIAAYNRADTLVEAIQSVLLQTFLDLEIIVVDDGSTDDTAERIAELDGPIHYHLLPHSGLPGVVRNRGLRHARGEVIAFLDHDDSWEPEKLACQVALLDVQPDVGLVYSGFSVLDENGVHVPELEPFQRDGPLLDHVLGGCFIHPSTVVVRRALLEEAGGFGERPAEDYHLWLRLGPFTRAACIRDPLVRLRFDGANRSSSEPRVLFLADSISILEETVSRGGLTLGQRRQCRAWISNLHVNAAQLASEAGDRSEARRHALAALGRSPVNRRVIAAVRDYLLRA